MKKIKSILTKCDNNFYVVPGTPNKRSPVYVAPTVNNVYYVCNIIYIDNRFLPLIPFTVNTRRSADRDRMQW